jgi:peptide/nickel transport system ATP-binding protein
MELRNRDFTHEPVVLKVENLVVALPGGTPVLRSVSFDIRKGETVCLVGESGSGKSVTSLTAMGLLPKDALLVKEGAIRLDGTDLLKLSAADMKKMRATRISMIFQEPMTALNPVMRVGEQVHLPDVERIYQSYPHQLSGGQRQRIMIAMALILEPVVLIADEPTTALDVTTQKQILSLIAELQEKHGTAVLFITHDMGVVAEIADRVCVMRSGEIVERGTIRDVLTSPQQQYTKDLLGSVPSLIPRLAREPQGHEAVIRVRDLGMTYKTGGLFSTKPGVKASYEVNFELQPGRTLGIVGESGSGKTTVARSIMRLIEPTEGEIVVDGRDIAHLGKREMKPFRKKLQVVFQDPFRSLNPRWTIEQSLTEGPVNYGVPYEEAVAEAKRLLKIVSLPEDSLKRYPHQFSGGQRQRIAIARAVALRPDILVADEAVSALDVSVQAQVLELLAELQRDTGIAIIFITHDLRVAAQICDEVLVMKRGQVVEQGNASDVLGKPSHEYTRSLIEAAPGRFWDFAAGRPAA